MPKKGARPRRAAERRGLLPAAQRQRKIGRNAVLGAAGGVVVVVALIVGLAVGGVFSGGGGTEAASETSSGTPAAVASVSAGSTPASAQDNASGDNASKPAHSTGGARLSFAQKDVDYGTVPLGKTVDYKFAFTNAGDQPLTIEPLESAEAVVGC